MPSDWKDATAPVVFELDEMWFLQSLVRHEGQGQREWQKPVTDLEFNELITDAILACVDSNLTKYTIRLTHHHCLIIDALVPNSAKTPAGVPFGKNLLLKAYRARRDIQAGGPEPVGEEPKEKVNVSERMAEFEEQYRPQEVEACEHCGRT